MALPEISMTITYKVRYKLAFLAYFVRPLSVRLSDALLNRCVFDVRVK